VGNGNDFLAQWASNIDGWLIAADTPEGHRDTAAMLANLRRAIRDGGVVRQR
jgi:hypothetical protein